MINFDDAPKENMKQHNPNWSQISDNLYSMRSKFLKVRFEKASTLKFLVKNERFWGA